MLIFVSSILTLGIFITLGKYSVDVSKAKDKLTLKISIIGTLVCMYILWGIVYMSQLNPLIKPDADPKNKSDYAREPSDMNESSKV